MAPRRVLEWLLEDNQPAVRYRTLRELLGKPEADSEVREAKRRIPTLGWAAEILARRDSEGWWVNGTSLYRPKYLSTNWMLLILSDLGVDRTLPAIRRSCELWIRRFTTRDGSLGPDGGARGHLCTAGNTARALIKFGYEDHPAVRRTLEWLVQNASPLGGWSCWGSGRNLDSWEGLSALAAYPRANWTPAMKDRVEKASEFFLERELYRQGDHYEPWYRFHYPAHYYYDLLVGLDLLTSLGYADDRRLRTALSVLKKKRRSDGRWNLDSIHPDVEGSIAEWMRMHPKQAPTPFGLETPGKPSKMVTLIALNVLNRVEGVAPRTLGEPS
ncbi:MAG: terpene cyclase/mutase family protein [Thermoplasmata archaeon]|nr:terpene cyclase/mutase family protein [Thermoplasmata archaeon]